MHADVTDRLADALVDGGRALAADSAALPPDTELRDHLAACPPCRREWDGLRLAAKLLGDALPAPMPPPSEARDATLLLVRSAGTPRGALAGDAFRGDAVTAAAPEDVRARTPALTARVPGRMPAPRTSAGPLALDAPRGSAPAPARTRARLPVVAGLAAAAAVAVLVVGALLGDGLVRERDRATQEAAMLASVTRQTGAVLGATDHHSAELTVPASGDEVGMVMADDVRLVVVADASVVAPGKGRWMCYLERDGSRIPVGEMRFAQGLAFWAGPTRDPSVRIRAGDRFLVVSVGDPSTVLEAIFR